MQRQGSTARGYLGVRSQACLPHSLNFAQALPEKTENYGDGEGCTRQVFNSDFNLVYLTHARQVPVSCRALLTQNLSDIGGPAT
jgi:hypothetical protein